MAFSSLPLYHIDPQNWHQQTNEHQQQQVLLSHQETPASHHQQIQPTQQTQHSQGGGGGGGGSSATAGLIKPNSMVDRARQAQLPLPEPGLKCPRCESTNTKFCYFNNYNLSQPRHFCKTCRRYWTRGGSLRNVPVGGGSRRTAKRSKGKGGNTSANGISSGSSMLRSPAGNNISSTSLGGGNNSCSTSLFLSHNLQNPSLSQLPIYPSMHHHLGNSNPSGLGLNLLGANTTGGSEMEFPSLLASFEGLRRFNGMHQFDNIVGGNNVEFFRTHGNGHNTLQAKPSDMDPQVIDGVAAVKIEESRGANLVKDFSILQGSDHHQQHLNWNTNVWTNGDLSSFNTSTNSSANHLLG